MGVKTTPETIIFEMMISVLKLHTTGMIVRIERESVIWIDLLRCWEFRNAGDPFSDVHAVRFDILHPWMSLEKRIKRAI